MLFHSQVSWCIVMSPISSIVSQFGRYIIDLYEIQYVCLEIEPILNLSFGLATALKTFHGIDNSMMLLALARSKISFLRYLDEISLKTVSTCSSCQIFLKRNWGISAVTSMSEFNAPSGMVFSSSALPFLI
ncbi:unnamed protein product [Schistosoma rodhaini]|nr:unnamed protein product [Schistosoma rodhaini]